MNKLYIVGVGPGSPDYLTYKARETAESADVLMGSERALELFPESRGEKLELDPKDMKNSFKKAISIVREGKTVVLLSTGDPGFSGLLKPVLNLSEKIDIEIIPGISSIQLCAAKLGISWDEANLITLHGKGNSKDLLNALENGKTTILLPEFIVKETAGYLLKQGVDPAREVAVCERLSYPDERVVKIKLKEILGQNFSYMCVMVIY
jgi:cobalt-precorrin-7 (C5)-methyltransferase